MTCDANELRERLSALERRLRLVTLGAGVAIAALAFAALSTATHAQEFPEAPKAATYDTSFWGDSFHGGTFYGSVRMYDGDEIRLGQQTGQRALLSSQDGGEELAFYDTLGTKRLALGFDDTGACYLSMRDILGRRRFHKRFR